MSLLATIVSPINDIVDSLGPNDLPYAIPVHPNLVHLTIGLFSIGIAFDFAGAFYPLEKRVFRLPAATVKKVTMLQASTLYQPTSWKPVRVTGSARKRNTRFSSG